MAHDKMNVYRLTFTTFGYITKGPITNMILKQNIGSASSYVAIWCI